MSGGPISSGKARRPRPVVDPRRVPEVLHGGVPPGTTRGERVVDLSLSTNPYGPPPFLELAWRRARGEVARYPDRQQLELKRRLADFLEVRREEVLLGGSASELLRCAIAAFGAGRTVLLPQYTYEEYARVARSVSSRVVRVPMPGLRLDPTELARRIPRKGLAILANPGTPDGGYLTPEELRPAIVRAERLGSLLLVDESYLPFVAGGESLLRTSDNVLLVFSWSKILGTPGVPLGHALGAPSVLGAVAAYRLPWSVGPLARHLGLLALEREPWIGRTLRKVWTRAAEVARRLENSSRTNYFAVDVGSARRTTEALERRGFRVRDLRSMGLPRHIRFSLRGVSETERFLRALQPYRVEV